MQIEICMMRRLGLNISVFAVFLMLLSGCSGYNKILKTADYDYKYNLAKSLFLQGKFTSASTILEECVVMFRGTTRAEESVYMLASCYYNIGDYLSASEYYKINYKTYPNGLYSELSRYYSGKSLYLDTPDPRLDPTSTYGAIDELQLFIEKYPQSKYRKSADDMMYTMYDRLVEKELKSATLYYNMGNYMGNNYRASIITAQNAMRDYPYTKYREELSFLVLKSKFQMAEESVVDKKMDRYRDAIDEYYAFKNDYPESKYFKDAEKIFRLSSKYVND